MKVAVLTGAGISAESGIQTFRDASGLWGQYKVEEVATPEAFETNPALVQSFYNERRRHLCSQEVYPNAAHIALSRFQSESKSAVVIITQNIDDLHERAGSNNTIHMHGELLKSRCCQCGSVATCLVDLGQTSKCDVCKEIGVLRPHVVWFGETPLCMDRIEREILSCDVFVSIGTSGNVYPAAGFAAIASNVGAMTMELNLQASCTPGCFDEARYGLATDTVPQLVDELLAYH